ncbi:MAG: tRNA (adenosine(37)-N6)-dimethylallyltransferase MiaA [Deltaproteobacteria bacterium]|nr:tRNA (adenosine(37)-N6)-dimethylallyltransferase MiaA [Deltaproteobacteria bacterium]
MNKIIVILGPTGVGKTEIAVRLAKKFNGEIINADSRQFYRDLVIGTAQPSEEVFQAVPHHLFKVSSLDDRWDAARFQKEADRLIRDISGREKTPFIVGGTGLYIRALLFGLFSGPAADGKIRENLEKRIGEEGLSALYGELKKIDPEACKTIHPNDPVRIIRALEVYRLTGIPISRHQQNHQFEEKIYDYLKLGIRLDRAILYKRIEARVDAMISAGLEQEVASLREKYGDHPTLLRSIGYEEWFPYLSQNKPHSGGEGGQAGKLMPEGMRQTARQFDDLPVEGPPNNAAGPPSSLAEATRAPKNRHEVIGLIKQNSRNFAKRQLSWFRHEKDIIWFEAGDFRGIETAVGAFFK